jgi:hypothetical protein
MALPNERPFGVVDEELEEWGREEGAKVSPCLSMRSRSSSSAAESNRPRACRKKHKLSDEGRGITERETHLVDHVLLLLQAPLEPCSEILRRLPNLLGLLSKDTQLVAHLTQLRRELETVITEEFVRSEKRDPGRGVGSARMGGERELRRARREKRAYPGLPSETW